MFLEFSCRFSALGHHLPDHRNENESLEPSQFPLLAVRPFNRLGQALRRRAERDRLLERVQRGGAGNRLIDGGLIAIDDRRGS